MSSSPPQNSSEHRNLLDILFSVFSGVLIGLFLSKVHTPNKNGGEAIAPQNAASDEGKSRQSETTLVAQTAPAPKQGNHADKRKRNTPLWEKLAAGAVALGTIGLLVVNIFALRAAKEAADGATQAVEEARKANNLSRAIFGTFQVTPQPQLGRIAIDIGNSGRAIAIVSSVTMKMEIQKLADNSVIQHEDREWKGPILVQSGFGKWFDVKGSWPSDPVSKERAIRRELWNDFVTVNVDVKYDSGFGQQEEQRFCQILVADERVNGPGKDAYIGNPACDDAAPFVQERKRQLGLLTN